MVGGGTTEPSRMPEWLEQKLQNSRYYKIAKRYYKDEDYPKTNSFYLEVERNGTIRAYDGWDYKRGLHATKSGIEIAEFERTKVPKKRWQTELSLIISFARTVRKYYDWNVIPVFDGYEIEVKPNKRV